MNCYTIDDSGEVQELFGIPFRKMIEEWLGVFHTLVGSQKRQVRWQRHCLENFILSDLMQFIV